jgi:hypothetical protein
MESECIVVPTRRTSMTFQRSRLAEVGSESGISDTTTRDDMYNMPNPLLLEAVALVDRRHPALVGRHPFYEPSSNYTLDEAIVKISAGPVALPSDTRELVREVPRQTCTTR